VGFSWNGAHSPEIGSGSSKGVTYLIVDLLCQAPLFGWLVAWCGNLQGASAGNMKRLMEKVGRARFTAATDERTR
jgi:hypothetical protein